MRLTEYAMRSLPGMSTHDQQWKLNPRPVDPESNALSTPTQITHKSRFYCTKAQYTMQALLWDSLLSHPTQRTTSTCRLFYTWLTARLFTLYYAILVFIVERDLENVGFTEECIYYVEGSTAKSKANSRWGTAKSEASTCRRSGHINSWSDHHDNWCIGTLSNRIVGGDGGCRVGEVWTSTVNFTVNFRALTFKQRCMCQKAQEYGSLPYEVINTGILLYHGLCVTNTDSMELDESVNCKLTVCQYVI